jgi:brefeldin A-inhibited guanine nucleotide-exchange protein
MEATTSISMSSSNGLEFTSPLSPTIAETPSTGDENTLKINGGDENGASDTESIHHPTLHKLDDDEAQAPAANTNGQQLEEFKPSSNLQQQPVVVTAARRRFFNRIISRCVLQLLMIETVNELFSNDTVYANIPSTELLRLMALLKRSFQFARRFNEDKELRMKLWREGFMKQPPNLLKQESGAAATYVSILFRMFIDDAPERLKSRPDIEAALVPLCEDIITGYSLLAEESQQRNIIAWRPVVVDVLEGFATFPEDAFKTHLHSFYPLAIDLLQKDLTADLRGIEGLVRAGDKRRDSTVSTNADELPLGRSEAAARKML